MPNKIKNMSPKNKIIISVLAVAVVAAIAVTCIVVSRNNLLATTMRLLKVQGTVNLEDSKGNSKPVIDNLRFQSGDALITGADGLASIGLDDTKIVTLQNDSRAEFKKKNKQLQLNLAKGAVFFNVTEKLKADETFEIKTATMTAGIRGTSGIVCYDAEDNNRESLMVTDGVVEVSATNPANNVTKTATVGAGKCAKVYFYDNDGQHEGVEFVLKDITPEDLKRFNLSWHADDEALINRICKDTGWDKDKVAEKFTLEPPSGSAPKLTAPTEPKFTVPRPTDLTVPKYMPPETPEQTVTQEVTVPTETTLPPETTAPSATTKKTPKTTTKKTTTKKTSKKSTKKKSTTKATEAASSEPSIPEGWMKYVWGDSYDGHKVYIIFREETTFDLKGYVGGKWTTLSEMLNDEGTKRSYIYGDKVVYYQEDLG